jgi:L-threonylcarbamoyladenylate synthase
MSLLSTDINKAVQILSHDDLVAIPTETVYGLAGNIYSEKAIKKIFELKKRPLYNPLIVHVSSLQQLDELVDDIPEKAKILADTFWPGPLTMVLKKKEIVPDSVTAGKSTVAVRIPNHPVTLQLLQSLDFPLAAPSANLFGLISPTNAEHVAEYFKDDLPMILDGGNCQNGIESTIIGFENNEAVLYRLGSLSIEDIENAIGTIKIKNNKEKNPDAPGMLSKHYAPTTPTFLTEDITSFIQKNKDKKIGLLLFNHPINSDMVQHQEILSKDGDLKEAAANLYAALHRLDKMNLDIIIAQVFPDLGLGKSINDRLTRATKK